MTSLIREYRQIPPFSGKKILYAYTKVPIIKDIQASFAKYRHVYSSAFLHIGAEADAYNAAQLNDMAAHNAQLEKDIAALDIQQRYAVKLQKEGNAKVDQVLKGLEGLNLNQQPAPAGNEKVADQLEGQLRAAGLKDEEVKKIMAALKFDAIPPISVTPSPGRGNAAPKKGQGGGTPAAGGLNVPKRPRASSQPREPPSKPLSPGPGAKKNNRAPSPSPSAAKSPKLAPKSPSPKPSAKSGSPAPKIPAKVVNSRILCVDRTNACKSHRVPLLSVLKIYSVRSLQAQAYLSLLRLWTANTSSPPGSTWLFRTVTSAGLNRPSSLSTSAKIPVYAAAKPSVREGALNAIAGGPHYFWSDNYPFEKEEVLKRLSSHESRGLAERDFETFDFMLCFSSDVYAELVELVKLLKSKDRAYEVKVRIVLIPGTEWYIGSRHTHVADLEEVTGDLKVGLKNWATKTLGWEKPADDKGIVSTIGGVQGRTVQMVLPGKYREPLGLRISDFRAGNVKETEGCWVQWEGIGKGGEILVCITGKKEKLKEAEAWVRALC